MSTPNERLALLRGLLHAAPSLWGWTQLCALFEGWPEDGTREVGLEYALQTLNAGWEDALRPPPQAWRAAWLAGEAPLGWPLVRAFDVILEESGARRLGIIRVVRAIEGVGLSVARDLAVLTPSRVLQAASLRRAEELALALEEEGASARCVPSASTPAPQLVPRDANVAHRGPPEELGAAPVYEEASWLEGLRASGGLGLALADRDPRVRARALNGLELLDAPEVGALLLPLLDDPIEGVANSALRAALRLRRSEDLLALLDRLEGLEEPEERDTFLQVFSWGLRALPEEQRTDGFRARLLGLALPLLEAPMASTRAASIALLRLVQPPEGAPRLRALLRDDPDDDVRLAAVNLLAELDYPERVEDMGWALDVGLAPHAPLQALGGSGAPEALPPLVRYLERAESYDINRALAAILRLRLPACQRWAVLALKNTDVALRLEGARLLLTFPAPEAREPLLRATFDINAEVAQVAREALGAL